MGDKTSLAAATKRGSPVSVSDPPQHSNPVRPRKQLQAYYAGDNKKNKRTGI